MLGLHGGSVVSSESLIDLLWGDDAPRTAVKALQTHISALRRALGDGFVITEGMGWILSTTTVDASRYKLATKAGRDAVARGDTSQAMASFDEALALWRGTPELPDSRRGLSEKTRWLEGHAAMVEDRADALLATGRAAELIGELEAAVGDAPLRERRWAQLILALYRAGRQGEALGAYQRARSLLADELGVDPGPELRRLETAIVAQDSALDYLATQRPPSVTRAVTFLLTDIEGSTAAWEADADAMAVALARHDELAEQVVTSRGGRLIKTRGEGDATFSVFDRPSAAAAAALELQEAIHHEPWALREPIRIRVALHTGEVELRDGDYFGRAVNRAARLRSLAIGGQILCSGATAELVIDALPDDVMLADLGMRQLRNLPRPEHVFELRLEAAVRPEDTSVAALQRPDLPPILTGPGPFVGRSRELERLASAWQTTLTDGIHAVLIAGEPGIGKTRLAGEWSRQAYEYGAVVLYGRSDEDLGAPYQPFAEALRSLVPCIEPKRLRGLRGLEALLSLVPGLADLLPDLVTPPRADPDTERYALFDAAVGLLELASASAPVVLILDDLHWAAKPTLLLLRHLLRFGDHTRLQVVATYRSTDLDRSHPLAAMLADLHRDGTADRLQLSGLDEDDVTAYVTEAGHDDEELAHALASVTGGNPFFLIEALRHVAESGGVWDPSTLPQGVREAVSRRLSRLPAETNKALAAAAVVGSRFALELVERVVDQDLVDAFDQAGKAGILIEESGGRYRFNHAIVRQSLLAELPSVRRMRLHQRIATTLEGELGADDELLADLAYHYFECAWAGNAAKAVEYCRRAADQAMARLAYEGAADLYDHALHALDELDEELPDRDEQVAELLIARCEALLAAGDVTSAAGAVAQLQAATIDSDRLAAWATCFDGQLSMLIHPERLDDVEVAVGQAARRLAEIADASGEAKAHTVRAGCLARLGRIGDCEDALDDALTAARRAGEHRRVNAVLANAPLAALWGPNPVPRAGGRCLDVVRLLRITTDSPAVEATSTRCQALLEAFRGRTEAARRMIDSARRTITELGLRHALLEVEQFAGMVELVADDPGAAEPHLRKAYHGFRRMGLDADTAETAAMLGRACLALDRDAEAAELCSESERLAGHALKASISWRTLRALLLARRGEHDEARRMAQAAVGLAERTDLLVDHGDACLALATVLSAAGDAAGARAAAEQSLGLYERKGAGALADMARLVLGEQVTPAEPPPADAPAAGLDNACVRAGEHVIAVINREAWDEVEQLFAPDGTFESRRKIVGFGPIDVPAGESPHVIRRILESVPMRVSQVVLAIRGERAALARLTIGTADVGPGSPQDEFLILYGIDKAGRVTLQVWFDLEDMDPAITELEALHAGFEGERAQAQLENAAVRASQRVMAAVDRGDWDAFEQLYAPQGSIESRRKVVGFKPTEFSAAEVIHQTRQDLEAGAMRASTIVVAVRGERLALARVTVGTADTGPGAPRDELLQLYDVDDQGRITHQIWFDVDDMDAAIAELDALHARFEADRASGPRAWNRAALMIERFYPQFAARDWDAIAQAAADNYVLDDRRRMVNIGIRRGRDAEMKELQATADVGFGMILLGIVATRGERLVLTRVRASGPDPGGVQNDALNVIEIDSEGRVTAAVVFDVDDFDAAIAELDARYVAGEAAAHARTWLAITGVYASVSRHEFPALTPDCVTIDHRRVTAFAPGELPEYIRAGWDLDQTIGIYVEVVHRLSDLGAVCSYTAQGVSREGFDAEWREIAITMVDGDMVSRCEMFDEADLDTALARFEELDSQTRRLENAASRLYDRFKVSFSAHDWPAIADMLADDVTTEDRRRVVNSGLRQGPDAMLAEVSAIVEVVKTFTSEAIATRGDRLVLSRARTEGYEAFITDFLDVVEVGADGLGVARIVFDIDDFDAAMAELDARYIAGEAAAYARSWSAIAGVALSELPEYTHAGWDLDQNLRIYIEVVHRLSALGAVCTYTAHGVSREGCAAEWREIALTTVDGDRVDRCEMFDENDLEAALARFQELDSQTRRLDNAASRVYERFRAYFAARNWAAVAAILADGVSTDDRRRLVGSDIRRGRAAAIAELSALATSGAQHHKLASEIFATRGGRLILTRSRYTASDEQAAYYIDGLEVVEIDTDGLLVARVAFDLDDFDAAMAELDARYLAGEAAAYVHTWSVIAAGFAAANRREMPDFAPDWVNIDHRQAIRIAPGDMTEYLHNTLDDASAVRIYSEVVHRLTNLGAVVTQVAHITSPQGFDAEWRVINLSTVDGDRLNRVEVFDEADLDAALARFDELSQPARRPENSASQLYERFKVCFAARDWRAIADMLADNVSTEDRRRTVNAGLRQGPDAVIAEYSGLVDFVKTFTSEAIATRGDRLVLSRARTEGYEAFNTDFLDVVEVGADGRGVARVSFDADDITAAIEELDARYLAGEAAAYLRTWSLTTQAYTAFNQHQISPLAPDWVNIDHRRGLGFPAGEMIPYIQASWNVTPDVKVYIESVHRLSASGTVITAKGHGTSQEGFAAEWRYIHLLTFKADLISRGEFFDEADLASALARFDELQAPKRLGNTASHVAERFGASFAVRDWDAMAELLADDSSTDDRRRLVGVGVRCGRDVVIADWRATADVGVQNVTSTPIATRGGRLVLSRYRFSGHDQRPEAFRTDVLGLVELDANQRIESALMLDLDEIDVAFAELDARYLAGEAAAHAHTWSVITDICASFNRYELPAVDWVNVDHRRGSPFASSDLAAALRSFWDLTPQFRIQIETVHRLSDLGAVITHYSHGTSLEGAEVEWRMIQVLIVEGDRITRCELFDEADLDDALARFTELHPQPKQLENTASRVHDRNLAHFRAGAWTDLAETLTEDSVVDDRRRVTSSGFWSGRDAVTENLRALADAAPMPLSVVATRGERLALTHVCSPNRNLQYGQFSSDMLILAEVDANDRITAQLAFDVDDMDSAFEELDSRYVAGEAAAYAHTWSVVTEAFAAINRHELPELTPDWVNIDHRRGAAFATGDMAAYMNDLWEDTRDFNVCIAVVHRLSSLGIVLTAAAHGTSQQGFEAQWREIILGTVDGELLCRVEIFDETDVDAALARFDELSRSRPALENAATRNCVLIAEAFNRRDGDAIFALANDDGHYEDRRKGLQSILDGPERRKVIDATLKTVPSTWRLEIEPIAVRGSRLSLTRDSYRDVGDPNGTIAVELLHLMEVDTAGLMQHTVSFDPDDIEAALAELDARYLAGEAAAHAQTWSLITGGYDGFNRRDLAATTPDWVSIDHRRGAAFASGDMIPYIEAAWDDSPDTRIYIAAVHRLSDAGAVVTHVAQGISQGGFDAEWRDINVLTVDGILVNRSELFDASGLDAALARFDELTAPD
ncbi:hypothetical protein A5772_13185 [Mycolicibacter sinensis]|uniref:Uncharacterized protein n=2 Tax=Mycolicibacter sinensis (strain JDM601) TaxID=875328 RepID=A0A1A2EKG6_MYCSD|nr:hypothetical protein A5772_13185 [Mycolicibacter sinensis]OBG06053.1 hypothetical protein A5771_09265 [Mycolicibacter sinensis]